jgi:hypothetical protein
MLAFVSVISLSLSVKLGCFLLTLNLPTKLLKGLLLPLYTLHLSAGILRKDKGKGKAIPL